LLTVLWIAGVLFYVLTNFGAGALNPGGNAIPGAPSFTNLALLIAVPVGFIWAIASIAWRSQELRILARSLDGVIARLSEPENVAIDSVVSGSTAIWREIAAVGDGIERALARASELEVMVQNEVSSLERSYSDNELRMRSLIDDLAGQREAILVNSERVRSSI